MDPTNSGGFLGGQRALAVRVLSSGAAIRLLASPIPGESDAFNVGPCFLLSTQQVADIGWHEPSQTLFASVPATGGAYSNHLVAIDPTTGAVTNAYPIGENPGQIELAPGADWLVVTLRDGAVLRRFDITTRRAGALYPLDISTDPVRFAYDFCVVPGLADSVVVEARDRDSHGNTWRVGLRRYDSGVPVSLPNLDASGGWLLEPLSAGGQVLLSPPLVKGNAATDVILATATNFSQTGVTYRDGLVYDDSGNFFSAGNLAWLGAYPGVLGQFDRHALTEVSASARRVFYLAGYFNCGWSFYKFKVYDRDLLQPWMEELAVPGLGSPPARFLRLGTNGLAYTTENGKLGFIRPDLIESPGPPADLHLSLEPSTAVAAVGTDYSFTLFLSNAGPGLASVVRVTNALPANTVVAQTSPSSGTVTMTGSAFTWRVAALAGGATATLQVTLRFGNGGWQTNLVYALGFEADPVWSNNVGRLPLCVQLPSGVPGAFPINFASEDLLYDPARDRLLLSVGNGLGGLSNGLAVLNPHSGTVESFVGLGQRPGKLARSDDGQFLYVSLPTTGQVRRLDLPTLGNALEFSLGGVQLYTGQWVWRPFFAGDMAVAPGAPDTLVVCHRVPFLSYVFPEYGSHIGAYRNGLALANVTTNGDWQVEFDPDSNTLFAFDNGELRRCLLEAEGVRFVETYPRFYWGRDDLEYGAGHLFSTAGRVIQLQPFRMAWLVSGVETASLVEPDAAANRLHYLIQTNGWRIRTCRLDRQRWLGDVPLPDVAGTPSSLIRWGTNGLAFRTSSNQLFLIRSPLVSPEAAADLGLQLGGPATALEPGGEASLTLNLTNQGPAPAVAVQITNRFSPLVTLVSVSGSHGSWSAQDGVIVWSLPPWRPGPRPRSLARFAPARRAWSR